MYCVDIYNIMGTMTTTRFISYICYSITCPEGITPARWGGMLAWARNNGYL